MKTAYLEPQPDGIKAVLNKALRFNESFYRELFLKRAAHGWVALADGEIVAEGHCPSEAMHKAGYQVVRTGGIRQIIKLLETLVSVTEELGFGEPEAGVVAALAVVYNLNPQEVLVLLEMLGSE